MLMGMHSEPTIAIAYLAKQLLNPPFAERDVAYTSTNGSLVN